MRRMGLFAIVVGCLLVSGRVSGQVAKKDAEKMQGEWTMDSVMRNGDIIPEEFLMSGKLVVKGDTYKVSLNEQGATATFKLDSEKSPKQIDLTYTDGPQKGTTIKGIYALDGETLKVCRGLAPETERPKKFEAPADSGLIYVVWLKAKVEPDKKDEKKDKQPLATTPAKTNEAPLSEAAKAEYKRFEGTWFIESMVIGGKDFPPEGYKGVKLILKDNTFVQIDPSATYKGTFKFDLEAKPKTIEMSFTEGPETGKTIQGIYELNEDTYKLCVGLGSNNRPSEFASKPGSAQALEVLKREKK